MNHPSYPPDARFAVSFHKGDPSGIPDGWPKDMRELRPGFPAQTTSDGKTELAEILPERVSDELAAKGYVEMTGAEIMAYREKFEADKQALDDRTEASEAKRGAMANQDIETMNRIGDGFEWPAGSGQRFSLSLSAQANMTRHAARCVLLAYAGPFIASTKETHERVEISSPDFGAFFAAACDALDKMLDDGRQRRELVKLHGPDMRPPNIEPNMTTAVKP